MAKRYTDTEIWLRQRWFKKIAPMHKLAFFYIKDQCDHAGIWKIDCLDLMENTGLKNFNLDEFVDACNSDEDKYNGKRVFRERIRLLPKGILWITGFIQFQYEGKDRIIKPTKFGPIKTAIEILNGMGLWDEALKKGYVTLEQPLHKGNSTLRERDGDKEGDGEEILKKGSLSKNEVIDTRLQEVFVEPHAEKIKMAYREIDVHDQWEKFQVKVRGAPDHYAGHSVESLRMAFQKHLDNAPKAKKINGQPKKEISLDDLKARNR